MQKRVIDGNSKISNIQQNSNKISELKDSNNVGFGKYSIPNGFTQNNVKIDLQKTLEGVSYKRVGPDETIEKLFFTSSKSFLINPIEPVNKPKHLTPFLLIEFGKNLLIEPNNKKKIYIKFPLEIGVFLVNGKHRELIDVYTFSRQKYTLYGEIQTGVLCRYWKSEVYLKIPVTDPLKEGVIELNVNNPTNKWITLTKAVFNSYGMKLYYSSGPKGIVAIKAAMKLQSELVAETEVLSKPLIKGMTQAVEIYTTLRPPVIFKTFVMEGGL